MIRIMKERKGVCTMQTIGREAVSACSESVVIKGAGVRVIKGLSFVALRDMRKPNPADRSAGKIFCRFMPIYLDF